MPIDFNVDRVTPIKTDHGPNTPMTVHASIPAPIDPFDTTVAKARFAEFEEIIKKMVSTSQKFEVTDGASYRESIQMGLQAKKLAKQLKGIEEAYTKDHRLYVTTIRNFLKVYTEYLKTIEDDQKEKFTAYSHRIEMARREAERKAEEAARKLQKQLNKEAKEKRIEPVQVPTPALPQKQAPVRTAEGSASFRKKWTFRVIDLGKVPDKFKVLDEVAINRAIKAAVRNIPGLEIYQKETPILRT